MSANKTFATKISAAAGSLAALTQAATTANAAIVHVDDDPVVLTTAADDHAQADWDVDGDGQREFYLLLELDHFTTLVYLTSHNANGRGFVNRYGTALHHMQNLSTGFLVEPVLEAGHYWGTTNRRQRTVLDIFSSSIGIGPLAVGFTDGVAGFAGFAFEVNDTTFYGWGKITIDTTLPGTVTIHEWAYEDNGGAIRVGAVPEPHSLALLAMGAAGLAAWRTRRGKTV